MTFDDQSLDDGNIVDDNTGNPDPTDNSPEDHLVSEVAATDTTDTEPDDSSTIDFEELTLADAVSHLLRAPRQTWRLLVQVAQTPSNAGQRNPRSTPTPEISLSFNLKKRNFFPSQVKEQSRVSVRLGLYLLAFLVAWWGTNILLNTPTRTETEALNVGAPLLLAGFLIWLGAEIYGDWPELVNWWQQRNETTPFKGLAEEPESQADAVPEPPTDALLEPLPDAVLEPLPDTLDLQAIPPEMLPMWEGVHPARVFMLLGAILCAMLSWWGNLNNHVTTPGFVAWLLSITLLTLALKTGSWNPFALLQSGFRRLGRINLRRNGTFLALILIMIVGAYFRLYNLDGVPPEMTSDHVEKLLDSQRVLDGTTQVFFPNNGGREPFQMYAMALFSQLPGLGMNFITLKLLAVVEALITLPVLWWMGREVIGQKERTLGNIVGLLLAGLVAVSYWHTALTRLALRIILTPLVTGLLIIYLSRGLRYNRRNDYIAAGLVLGFGLYTYQAVRMLPVVVVVGVGFAFIIKARNWAECGRYIINLAVLVAISAIIFVPMLGFWMQYPEDFWRRTSGRLLGDDIIQVKDEEGNITYRDASLGERLEAFNKNLPVLMDNIRNALLMYNWKGDVGWINGAPNYPAMDMLTGALFVVGLAAWLARMVRRRDVVDWLMPVMLLIMLMPSALSIAYPMENPSATRTSGSLPEAYLFAAFPLGLIVYSIKQLGPKRGGTILATGLVGLVMMGAYSWNYRLYFDDNLGSPPDSFYESYLSPSLPYTQAGKILRGFAESDGSFGNAFMIAYPYWWDHRALGMEAGLMDWPNGILKAEDVPQFLYDASQRGDDYYLLDPNKDLLFFYSVEDEEADRLLQEWFPEGRARRIESYQNDGDDFMIYRVPFLGMDDFLHFTMDYR